LAKIERRINDMKLRMKKEDFEEIENKYDRWYDYKYRLYPI
jgi:hypothetical protein